jgi:hypothetical protein
LENLKRMEETQRLEEKGGKSWGYSVNDVQNKVVVYSIRN